jgi:hypothetical protein
MIHSPLQENDPLSPQNEATTFEVWSAEPLTPELAREIWMDFFVMECTFSVDRAKPFGRKFAPFLNQWMGYLIEVEQMGSVQDGH